MKKMKHVETIVITSSDTYRVKSIIDMYNEMGYRVIAVTDVLLDRELNGKCRREIVVYLEKISYLNCWRFITNFIKQLKMILNKKNG